MVDVETIQKSIVTIDGRAYYNFDFIEAVVEGMIQFAKNDDSSDLTPKEVEVGSEALSAFIDGWKEFDPIYANFGKTAVRV